MSSSTSEEKKLIRAPGDLVLKFSEAAKRQGKTVYNYITEILEQALRAHRMKRSLEEIIDQYELLELHREAGAVFTPRDVLEYLINEVGAEDAEVLQQLWYRAGGWYGIYLKEKFDHPVDAFIRFLRDGRWDLNEVRVKSDRERLEVRCVSALLSQERTVLLQKFIEGAMHSIGYKTLDQESFRGIIRLWFSPSSVS